MTQANQLQASKRQTDLKSSTAADERLELRIRFDVAFAAIFIVALHGVSALKILAILYLNYKIATALPKQYVAPCTWTFNIVVLFANELCRGYPVAKLAALLLPVQTTNAASPGQDNWGTWIDSYGGLIPRWEVLFNITVLRLISFNLDYLWSLDRRAGSPIEVNNVIIASHHPLIHSRRRTLILQISQNEIVLIYPRSRATTLLETTLLLCSTPLCT